LDKRYDRQVKRIERPPRVLYVERQIALGMVCLYLLAVGVGLAFMVPGIRIIWLGAVPFGVMGVVMLFHRRVFGIDRDQGLLVILQQGLLKSKARASYELKDLDVRIVTLPLQPPGPAVIRQDVHYAWVYRNGEQLFQLIKGQDLGMVRELAEGFARDLGRPFQIVPPLA
jgi:hypothetical protein